MIEKIEGGSIEMRTLRGVACLNYGTLKRVTA